MKNAILVKRNDPRSDEDKNEMQMLELKHLADSAGYTIIGEMSQTRHPGRKYQIGRGKVDELSQLVQDTRADKIIFYNQLSTTQIYNISETCSCEVIDKFQLILEIFATRATTARSKLQVELARLEYELPKARTIVSLLKKEERPGFMGLGGYEDSYEQDIKGRISRIRNELKNMEKDSVSLRKYRHSMGFALVTLAGYTNAGKSTLFNALVEENVTVKDMLFTTLVPTTRSMKVVGRDVLLTDTVGFIEELPHWMVDAFRSTLNEIFLADIVLLTVDSSESFESIRNKLLVCHETMWDELQDAAIVTVFNKADKISGEELDKRILNLGYLAPNPVAVSAKTAYGLDTLKEELRKHLPKWERTEVVLPMNEEGMSMVSWLFDRAVVHGVEYGDNIDLDLEAMDRIINKARALSSKYFDLD